VDGAAERMDQGIENKSLLVLFFRKEHIFFVAEPLA
jgi:hypothetical protein